MNTETQQQKRQLGQSNHIHCRNYADDHGNPSGGYAHGPGMCISWQDGPRGRDHGGNLFPANGAFVEDALVAAHQRLAFFQESQYAHSANAEAMDYIELAIDCLKRRADQRSQRGVLGQNVV